MTSLTVVPMISVLDIAASIDWYKSVGFEVTGTHDDDGEMNWARLRLGESHIMLSAGGLPQTGNHREVVLYIKEVAVDEMFADLPGEIDVVREPYDAFHGHRELVLKDPSGYWVVFAQTLAATD